ncbi:hypothetical protein ACHAPU_000621 [Fusarium lateritium]
MPAPWKLSFLIAPWLALAIADAGLEKSQLPASVTLSSKHVYPMGQNQNLANVVIPRQEDQNNAETTVAPNDPEETPGEQVPETPGPEIAVTAIVPGDSEETAAPPVDDDSPDAQETNNAPGPADPEQTTAAQSNGGEDAQPPTADIPQPQETAQTQNGDDVDPQAPNTVVPNDPASASQGPVDNPEPTSQGQNPETRGQEPETEGQDPQTQDQNPETQAQEPQTQGSQPETRGPEATETPVQSQDRPDQTASASPDSEASRAPVTPTQIPEQTRNPDSPTVTAPQPDEPTTVPQDPEDEGDDKKDEDKDDDNKDDDKDSHRNDDNNNDDNNNDDNNNDDNNNDDNNNDDNNNDDNNTDNHNNNDDNKDDNKDDNPEDDNPEDDNPEDDDPEDDDPDDDDPEDDSPVDKKPEDDCEKQEPVPCTKTVSYYPQSETYTSTVYVTCPALVDCPARETPTMTTTVFPTVSVVFGELEEEMELPELEEVEFETKQYFQQVFDDENISINDGLHPEVKCDRPITAFQRSIPRECFLEAFPAFCSEADKDKKKALGLNVTGDGVDTGSQRKRATFNERRDMLQTRNIFCALFQFEFGWDGTPEPDDCYTSCEDSMIAFGDECFDAGHSFREGTIDVGCSTYRFTARSAPRTQEPKTEEPKTEEPKQEDPKEDPPTPLALKSAVCENEEDFGKHPDVSPDFQFGRAGVFCGSSIYDNKVANMGPSSKPFSATHKGGKTNYWYEVSWVEGCKTTVDSQSVANPLGDKGPRCADLFKTAFKSCDNGGVGGYIEAGCIRYNFKGGFP